MKKSIGEYSEEDDSNTTVLWSNKNNDGPVTNESENQIWKHIIDTLKKIDANMKKSNKTVVWSRYIL